MSRSAVILRNIASNWIGFTVNAAVMLVLTPFILRELGVGRYGVWILASSIIGYYGLLDVGFRAGVNQYLTRYLALRDYNRGSECISSAMAALSALGVLLATLSVGTAYLVPYLFNLPPSTESEAFWCILIVGSTSGIQFAMSPFGAIFSATQRFDLANLIGVSTRLLTAGGVLLALKMDYGLIGVSIATCSGNVIDNLIRFHVSGRLVPELSVSRQLIKLDRLREIYSFGAWNFLMSLNAYICTYVPNMLVGYFMPVAAVGHYALAAGLYRQINSVLSPIGQVMYPAATAMHTVDDRNGLERLYHDGSRLMLIVMIPIVLIAAFWSDDFYRLWIGEKYLSGEPFHSVALLFNCLLIGTFTTYFSNIGAQILVGAGRVKVLAVALFLGSLINLTLSLILIRFYDLAGVAIAAVISSVIVDLIGIPLLLQKVLGFSVARFLRKACVRPLGVGVLLVVLMEGIRLLGHPGNWLDLILHGALAGVSSIIILLSVGITATERQRFVLRPFCNLCAKVRTVAEKA